MVSAVSSSSAALKVLRTQVLERVASGPQDQDPLQRFLDPRSVRALAPQSFDALLKLKTELRREPVQGLQAQEGVSLPPRGGKPGHSGKLAWENEGTSVQTSNLDRWAEGIERLKARTSERPDSPLLPWNSPDVIQQLRDMDKHGAISSSRERAFLASDAAIYKGMAETPPEDVARIKAKGGEIWYEDSQFFDRRSDKEFFRDIKNYALYGGSLDEPIDPSNARSQALLKGTAQIIRGSRIQDFFDHYASYTMYAYNSDANQYKWLGGWDRDENNARQIIDELQKTNPTMKVSSIWAGNDVAFILYPKTDSTTTAAAEGRAAGTITPLPAMPVH
ncbi:hypothetical protein SAMN05216360_10524 [Methylobacterium phyllostachyos]|uniref:Uncharacterized protein n=1 Tax=Methylobacterium phyllostachyos TaxID=582672 RepID=A0A1G9XT50_9HYPH|nr:hypothetical protein [Methylobacterium phyllostachyos]SDM99992.1 hypothetical protein SAMN05216360_10524 [Methylobacterium phyllostachyos]